MEIMNIPYKPYLPAQSLPRLAPPRVPAGGRMRGAQKIDRGSRLYAVSKDFEAIFIKQMLNVMRKSVNKTGLLDGGLAEEFFEDMLYDQYAQKMADSGSFGIADMIYRQLSTAAGPSHESGGPG